jgi:DNA-binding SARP family transcriptional activator
MSIRLRLLQRPSLQLPSGAEVGLGSQDAILLAILAIDGPTPRERLAAWLWPDAAPAQARANLRQRLFRVRKLAGHEIVSAGAVLRLSPLVLYDTELALAALRQDPHAAEGELLGVHEYLDCHDLDHWLRRARANWRARVHEVVTARIEMLEAQGHLDQALAYAHRMVRDEPLHEHAHRVLMKLLHQRGDRSAALQVYERMRQALHDELGVAPSLQSDALRTWIESADKSITSSASALPLETPQLALAGSPPGRADRPQHRHANRGDLAAEPPRPLFPRGEAEQAVLRLFGLSEMVRTDLPYLVRRKVKRLLLEAQSLVESSARTKAFRAKPKKRKHRLR